MPSSATTTSVLLVLLAIIGALGTWGLAMKNGQFSLIESALTASTPLLPSSNVPMKTHWTGIRAADKHLTLLNMFFWPVVDGSNLAASLQALKFVGEFTGIWVLLEVEGFRTALLVHPTELRILPYSVFIGILTPTLFAALPSPAIVSHTTHQAALVLWQLFPLWAGLSQLLLSMRSTKDTTMAYQSSTERNGRVLKGLERVYGFAFAIVAVTHIAPLAISLIAAMKPDALPGKYAAYVDTLHPANAFLPSRFWGHVKMVDSIGEGSLEFLKWDELVSTTSVLVWACALNWQAAAEHNIQSLAVMVAKTLLLLVFAGPVGAAILLVAERDEAVLSAADEAEIKKQK
ncbi:hypothetical protein LTR16_000365 [Cryomyces antarcticus]|uniref:Uncharacterized protein n=1 Tax=Cryomyces antarcticus TaxID=329879 RepID=A0ABR0M023_9PEZI|nr:hypothetical protein LTR39_000233 [Cryomyces antarcticus]KAK5020042.1 hypothetical protein LTR60_000895 [Cryomyces antarcticus]KAK5257541.1 hypothetical protein LTR16_000365 [Cryomyces antarcticus]